MAFNAFRILVMQSKWIQFCKCCLLTSALFEGMHTGTGHYCKQSMPTCVYIHNLNMNTVGEYRSMYLRFFAEHLRRYCGDISKPVILTEIFEKFVANICQKKTATIQYFKIIR